MEAVQNNAKVPKSTFIDFLKENQESSLLQKNMYQEGVIQDVWGFKSPLAIAFARPFEKYAKDLLKEDVQWVFTSHPLEECRASLENYATDVLNEQAAEHFLTLADRSQKKIVNAMKKREGLTIHKEDAINSPEETLQRLVEYLNLKDVDIESTIQEVML
jgi:hypothetical protein